MLSKQFDELMCCVGVGSVIWNSCYFREECIAVNGLDEGLIKEESIWCLLYGPYCFSSHVGQYVLESYKDVCSSPHGLVKDL